MNIHKTRMLKSKLKAAFEHGKNDTSDYDFTFQILPEMILYLENRL